MNCPSIIPIWPSKNILSAYGYSARLVLLILFLYIIHPQGKKLPYWTVAGINGVLYFTSPLAKLFFEIRESDFASLWGPLGFLCLLISGIFPAELLLRSDLRCREARKPEQLIPVSAALVIAVSVVLDMSVGMAPQPAAFLTIAIVTESVFLHLAASAVCPSARE